MGKKKTVIGNLVPPIIIFIMFVLIFSVFTYTNRRRIISQNADYLKDEAHNTVNRVDELLNNAKDSLSSFAYLCSNSLESPDIDREILQTVTDNTLFNMIEFVDKDGIDYMDNGKSTDVSDRTYFQEGMKGNSGIDVVLDSRLSEENMVAFYSPIKYGDEVIGVLVGYYGADKMEQILSTSFFGEKSNTYLCLRTGDVISSSGIKTKNIIEAFSKSGDFDDKNIKTFRDAFENYESHSITYEGISGVGNAYVTQLAIADWVLVQTFPSTATDRMVDKANRAGVYLAVFLTLIFLAYVIALIVRNKKTLNKKDTDLFYWGKLFDILTNNSNDIYVLFSAETFESEYISPNLYQVLGVEPESIKDDIRKILYNAVGDKSTFSKDKLDQIPVGGVWKQDRTLRHCNTGELCWYQEAVYHINFHDIDKYVLLLSDRTGEHKYNLRLRQALDDAKSANKAKSNFLFNMSHDIRTPLNAIIGFSTLLAKDADDGEKVREYTQKIGASGHHLLSLINDILDMSKIESGSTSLNVSEFAFAELLDEINAIILPQTQARKQSFTLYTQGKVPEYVIGDRLRINQILINLLSNAVKYTQNGGKIELVVQNLEQVSPKQAKLSFTVKDNGIGMSREFVERIFEPFTREANVATEKTQGTGLGMAITKNIVDLMGGIIKVDSAPGEGSTFTVELELELPEKIQDENFWEMHSVTRVLVVDDEEDVCYEVKRLMEDTGVSVEYTTRGKEAVELAVKAKEEGKDYSVIILDWKMPEQDGVETARQIREKAGKEIPILVLTGYEWSDIEPEARAAGVNTFMTKPFFVSVFKSAIERLGDQTEEGSEYNDDDMKRLLDKRLFLAAEDNELNAEILSELLSIYGARCDIAQNGEQAVEMFAKSEPGHYDAILMDIQMPVMNGYDAARAIRKCKHADANSIPIIAMTANAFAEDVQNSIKAGMNEHVAKPIDIKELAEVFRKYLH